jgi:hypothetical protein
MKDLAETFDINIDEMRERLAEVKRKRAERFSVKSNEEEAEEE